MKAWQKCKTLRLYLTNLTKSTFILVQIMHRYGSLTNILINLNFLLASAHRLKYSKETHIIIFSNNFFYSNLAVKRNICEEMKLTCS